MKSDTKKENGRKKTAEEHGIQSKDTEDNAKSTDGRESDEDSEDDSGDEADDNDEEEDNEKSDFSDPDDDLDDDESTAAVSTSREDNLPEGEEDVPDKRKIETSDKGEEDQQETPEIKVMTISTRGSKNIKDPIKQVNQSGVWPSEREATGYYHIHPNVLEIPEVKEIVEMHYGQLNIREGIPEDDFNNKPKNQIERSQEDAELGDPIIKAIKVKNDQLSVHMSDKGAEQKVIKEVQESRYEQYKNLLLSDHKEFYSQTEAPKVIIQKKERRSTKWLNTETAMPPEDKISQLNVVFRNTGNGTSNTDMKVAHGIPQKKTLHSRNDESTL